MRYGKNNPEYSKYIHSRTWKKKAKRRLEMDGYICQVCGKEATDVHHLTYEHFKNEEMSDLVSLCRHCHDKAEEIYETKFVPCALREMKGEGNFMAVMETDAVNLAPVVFDWLKKNRGDDFHAIIELREPDNKGGKYWSVLRKAVNALCGKRYCWNYIDDRADIMIETITNRTAGICLKKIERYVRNLIQKHLHDTVMLTHENKTWPEVANEFGIKEGTLQKLRQDDGTSSGPSIREDVLLCCGKDAAAGIRPIEGLEYLTTEDYAHLNSLADYVASVSGSGKFKGE